MSGEEDQYSGIRNLFSHLASTADSDAAAVGHTGALRLLSSDAIYDCVTAEVTRAIPLGPQHRLLDIGCGGGGLLERLRPLVAEARGIDVTAACVELARGKGLTVDHYDGDILPYESKRFDIVVLNFVLINIPSRGAVMKLLSEAYRVTAPGGSIFIGDNPHPYADIMPNAPVVFRPQAADGTPQASTFSIDYDVFAEFMARHVGCDLRFAWSEWRRRLVGQDRVNVVVSKSLDGDPEQGRSSDVFALGDRLYDALVDAIAVGRGVGIWGLGDNFRQLVGAQPRLRAAIADPLVSLYDRAAAGGVLFGKAVADPGEIGGFSGEVLLLAKGTKSRDQMLTQAAQQGFREKVVDLYIGLDAREA